jgi:hypothetical protein
MKPVLLAFAATMLLVGCSKHDATTDSTPNPGVGTANPGVPGSVAANPRAAPSTAASTSETTTPDQALALAGVDNQNMAEAERYLANHPAALAARHRICHGLTAAEPTDALQIYCGEMEHADLTAFKPVGVTNSDNL